MQEEGHLQHSEIVVREPDTAAHWYTPPHSHDPIPGRAGSRLPAIRLIGWGVLFLAVAVGLFFFFRYERALSPLLGGIS